MIDFDLTRPEVRRRMHVRRLTLVIGGAGTLLVLYTVHRFVLAPIASLRNLPLVPHPPSWLGYTVTAFVAAIMFGSVLFSVLPAQRRAVERNPSAAFTAEQRRQVWRKIRGRDPVSTGEIPLLRAAAGAAYAYRWVAAFLFGFLVQNLWVAVVSARPAPWVLFAAAWLLFIVLLLRRARHGKAFLYTTSDLRD